MGKTRTFTDLLDKCESPVQTFIILAQLKLLRQQEQDRNKLNPRAGATSFVMLVFMAIGALLFWSACNLAGQELDKAITRAIGY